MENQVSYEYLTVQVDVRPRRQAKELKKLAKDGGWEVVSIRAGTYFADLSQASTAVLRRVTACPSADPTLQG